MNLLYDNNQVAFNSVGIDISKDGLDVHIYPADMSEYFSNDTKGFKAINKWLENVATRLIVFESTGLYHRDLQAFLSGKGHRLAVINPYRSRRFAQALCLLAKTDKADARMLAQYGAMVEPEPTPLQDKQIEILKELIVARRAMVKRMTQITNHMQGCRNTLLKRQSQQAIAQCRRHLAQIDLEMKEIITKKSTLNQQFDILTSIPAIGPATAFTLIAEMPELGDMTAKQVSLLTELAPIAQDSGMYRGRWRIKAGRSGPRMALYMAAVASLRFNPDMIEFYARIKLNGKPPKVALVAVMQKLVILANALIAQQRKWQQVHP